MVPRPLEAIKGRDRMVPEDFLRSDITGPPQVLVLT